MSPSFDAGIAPATPERWRDLEALFGERGACAGCWCMYWRLTSKDFARGKGAPNRQTLHDLVIAGETPGLLAYDGDRPIGWIAVAPREAYPRLARSRILKPLDDTPVWSIVCLFIDKGHRRRGVSAQLIRGAVDYVADQGGRVVEAYPVEPRNEKMPDVFAWTGIASAFLAAGFVERGRRSETRPILRYDLGEDAAR